MKDTDSRLASKVYKLYAEFFDKAEQERRWNPYRDIPWERVNRDATEELALCAETFFAVESYLPDYVAQGINIVPRELRPDVVLGRTGATKRASTRSR